MEQDRLSQDVEVLKESLGPLPQPVVRPGLVILTGLPGTGKSHFAHRLAEKVPVVVLESDALRKVLFPRPTYCLAESRRLFEASHRLIEQLLCKGIQVVLDATNLEESRRIPLYAIADRRGAKLIIVRMKAPEELVQERMNRRAQGLDAENSSEAGWAVYQKMKRNVERIGRNHYVVDTSNDIGPVLEKVVRRLTR